MPKLTHALLRSTSAFLAMLLIESLGCKDTISPASTPTGALAPVRSVAPALHDAGMSDLSPVAQHIIVALRDSAVRVAVIDALKQSTNGHIGIDLSSCNGISLGAAIISASERPEVKLRLQKIAAAETQKECERLKREFRKSYEQVHPKAAERLERDWERMITYYRFPAEHWTHIRTTNVVESPFCSGATPHWSSEAIQEGRERDGLDLEDAPGRAAEL